MQGAFFDPANEGCGFFFLDHKDGNSIVSYYGHDFGGRPFWLTGYGKLRKGVTMFVTHGTGFPTVRTTEEPAGSLLVFDHDEHGFSAELQIQTRRLSGPVDFSPQPPADHITPHLFKLRKI